MTALMIIQLLIVLLALYVGSRYGSLALGADVEGQQDYQQLNDHQCSHFQKFSSIYEN